MLDIQVPNVNERKRIPMRAIRAVTRHIAEQFRPDKIILFGSYAYGHPKPWSDVDLLVVMDTLEGEFELAWAISRSLSPHPFGMDILVRSQSEIENRIALGDWFIEDIMTQGKVLYEKDNRGVGLQSRNRLRPSRSRSKRPRKANR